MEGPSWVRNILLTCCIYCGPLLAVFSVNNTVAIFYRVCAFSLASNIIRDYGPCYAAAAFLW